MDYFGMIQTYVKAALLQEREQLERLCEIMLTTPDSPGISVQRTWSGMSCSTLTRLDPAVPFGEIHYLPDVIE